MKKAFVLATGQSMSQPVADAVFGRGMVVAVSDAYRLAPWADYLVSTDAAWWAANEDAKAIPASKYCAAKDYVEGVQHFPGVPTDINSGLLGLNVAVAQGAKMVVLLGIDLHGPHFFGAHKPPLKNTPDWQFESMQNAFAQYQPRGVDIVNCSPTSVLRAYRRAELREVL